MSLTGVDFTSAYLQNANLGTENLSGANVTSAKSPNANLKSARQRDLNPQLGSSASRLATANVTTETIRAAVYGFFDAARRWVASLPDQNLANFLQGALLLIRRTLFNQAPQSDSVQVFNYSEVIKPGGPNDLPTVGTVQHPSAQLAATDPESDNLIWSAGSSTLTTANGGHVVLNSDGSFRYTPAAGFNGTDQFAATVTDASSKVNLVDLGRPSGTTVTVQVNVDSPQAIVDYFNQVSFLGQYSLTTQVLQSGDGKVTLTNSSSVPPPPGYDLQLGVPYDGCNLYQGTCEGPIRNPNTIWGPLKTAVVCAGDGVRGTYHCAVFVQLHDTAQPASVYSLTVLQLDFSDADPEPQTVLPNLTTATLPLNP